MESSSFLRRFATCSLILVVLLSTTKHLYPSLNQYATLTITLPLFFLSLLLSTTSKSSIKLPPGPSSIPIFGNRLQVGNDLTHRYLASMSKKYGKVFLLKLGARNRVVVSDPTLASQVLNSQGVEFGSPPRNVVFDTFTGDGQDMVFTAYGDHWRKMRRIMTVPFFTKKVVQQYSRNMWEEEMELVVKDLCMDNEGAGQAGVVIRRRLQLMLYNILYRMMFYCRFESMDPMFIEATRFNSERSRLAQSCEYNYGDFIPLLRPFLNGYLERCREVQSSRLKFFDNH